MKNMYKNKAKPGFDGDLLTFAVLESLEVLSECVAEASRREIDDDFLSDIV